MLTRQFVRRTRIAAPVERVFQWHELPDVFEKLTPPREPVRVIERSGGIRDGGRMVIEIGYPPLSIRWTAEHSAYIKNRQFRDIQVRGPFRQWVHTHLFEADGPEACYLEDRIEYAMKFGIIGDWLLGWMIERKLDNLFQYRHRITQEANL